MTIDLFDRYAALDPAKEPDKRPRWTATSPVLPSTDYGSEQNMQTQQQMPTQPESSKPKRPGWLAAAAAFVLILAVGAVVLFSNQGATDVPATETPSTTLAVETDAIAPDAAESEAGATITPTEALNTADAFYLAYNAGEPGEVLKLFTLDATFGSNFGESVDIEVFEMDIVWNAAQGKQLTSEECTVTQTEAAQSVTVECVGETRDALSNALDGSGVQTRASFVVTPDGITQLDYRYGEPDFTDKGGPFDAWMESNNPDDAERASFGAWTTIEEAAEYGAIYAKYAKEWATYLVTNGCVYKHTCLELEERTPDQTIRAYTTAYNTHNIDAVMAFFTEESAVTGHPFAAEAVGLSAIRILNIEDIAAAAEFRAYMISNLEVNGDTVTWDHVWTNDEGDTYCQQGQTAIVKDGTILTWTWPQGDDASCP